MLGRSKRPVALCPPCDTARKTKTPHDPQACACLTCHGFYAASTDPDRIAAMTAAVPRGILAIRTGAPSVLVVIDVDPRHCGTTSLRALIDRGLTPPTRYVHTGGGGLHLYYGHPGQPVPCDEGIRLGPGIDVKADGGYVVAPPSRHPDTGRPYRWADDGAQIRDMAPALVAACVAEVRRRAPVRPAGQPLTPRSGGHIPSRPAHVCAGRPHQRGPGGQAARDAVRLRTRRRTHHRRRPPDQHRRLRHPRVGLRRRRLAVGQVHPQRDPRRVRRRRSDIVTRPKTNRPAIDGADLLDRLRAAIKLYVILPSTESLDAVVLWIAATYALPAWACAPRLVIRAPEKRCGKSRLLDLIEAACHNPLITVNASPAAVYRAIGTDNPPTLLIDEYDTIFRNLGDNDDLRGLLNAGHQRNRPAIRYDNNAQCNQIISTFAMAAMAGIGAAPDTIEDRAVVVHMRRRAGREKVKPWRIMRDRPAVAAIGAELSEWLLGDLDALRVAEPVMPVEDRAADTWEPLIAVADLAGGDWPIRARTAAVTLTGAKEENAATSDRVRLLIDCRTIFAETGADALPTALLLERLRGLEESPWSDLNPYRLGALLRVRGPADYGAVPHRTGEGLHEDVVR
ncbi:DUF3631 domain-containing protein [Catellatospora coxensis]